jgi:hypothetical protein
VAIQFHAPATFPPHRPRGEKILSLGVRVCAIEASLRPTRARRELETRLVD